MAPDIYSALWALDHNRLKRGVDYKVDLCGDRLFPFVKWSKLDEIPTYRAFLNLLNNYEADVEQPEKEGYEEEDYEEEDYEEEGYEEEDYEEEDYEEEDYEEEDYEEEDYEEEDYEEEDYEEEDYEEEGYEEEDYEEEDYEEEDYEEEDYEEEDYEEEEVTEKEENDARAFLNRCLDTKVMEEAHAFLAKKGCAPECKRDFKEMLYKMWFTPYTRTHSDMAQRLSSAFEHTFVGETRCGHVIGFHNWLRLYDEECRGNIRYKPGCKCYDCKCKDRIVLTIDFDWKGNSKTRDSFFVGTSPEFELALYTVCFLSEKGPKTGVVLDGCKRVTIATYKLDGHIGSCYPILEGDSGDNLWDEGLDFLEYLEDEDYGSEMGKRRLKEIYEEDYTRARGRRGGTAFSQVLRTLEWNKKVKVKVNNHGVDVVAFLE
ncbi:uncharacterized protein LOC144911638 [Branchiostoma floridae x Branchiostoma belcheri]